MNAPEDTPPSRLTQVALLLGIAATAFGAATAMAQLMAEPAPIIVAVFSVVLIAVGLYAMYLRRNRPKSTRFWVLSTSLVAIGGLTLTVTATAAAVLHVQQRIVVTPPTAQPHGSGPAPQTTTPSAATPTTEPSMAGQPTKPLWSGTVTLYKVNGIDVDQPKPKPVEAGAAAGDIDVAFTFLTPLEAAGKGFYKLGPSDDSSKAVCQEILNSLHPSSRTATAYAGSRHCMRTSAGNIALVAIDKTFLTDISQLGSENVTVTLTITVWRG